MPPSSINILGVKVNPLTVPQLHDHLACAIESNRHELVLHVNVHGLNLAGELPWLHEFLNQAEIVFCDGAGVMLGARFLGHHIPERITYADWIWQLAEFAALRDYSIYFLGAQLEIAHKAAEQLRAKTPELHIAGVHHGYFDKTPGHPENEAVLADINRVQPNILLVGMGMPLQELWLRDNWTRINANVALTGGAVFDYVSGNLQRAPRWMTDNGLEWLGRLVIEPHRLWKRYILGNPQFLWNILRQRQKAK
jgi:N-acetylglucosaminyldiphosphoundecaprenol N-acetyl-beta-D-mannosaminyltransferase